MVEKQKLSPLDHMNKSMNNKETKYRRAKRKEEH
jgi:hypothetical protein